MTKRRIDEVHDGGYSRVIAEHYNKIEDSGLEQRSESKIICMRSFNNWIKSLIVNEFVDLARENCHANPTNIKVLDVGCGKGGDLKKYIATDIQHLVCTGKSHLQNFSIFAFQFCSLNNKAHLANCPDE